MLPRVVLPSSPADCAKLIADETVQICTWSSFPPKAGLNRQRARLVAASPHQPSPRKSREKDAPRPARHRNPTNCRKLLHKALASRCRRWCLRHRLAHRLQLFARHRITPTAAFPASRLIPDHAPWRKGSPQRGSKCPAANRAAPMMPCDVRLRSKTGETN